MTLSMTPLCILPVSVEKKSLSKLVRVTISLVLPTYLSVLLYSLSSAWYIFIGTTEPHTQTGTCGFRTLPSLARGLGFTGKIRIHPCSHLQINNTWLQTVLGQILQDQELSILVFQRSSILRDDESECVRDSLIKLVLSLTVTLRLEYKNIYIYFSKLM